MKMLSMLSELFEFVRKRKKWWLAPIIVFLILFGALLVLSQGSAVTPFIYALF